MALVTTAVQGVGFYNNAAGAARSAWFARATADADCTISFRTYESVGGGGDVQTLSLTGAPHRAWYYNTGKTGQYAYTGGTCTRFCVDDAQNNASTVPDPFYSTSGSVYSGPATVVSEGVTLTNPAKWCVGVTAQASGNWEAGTRPLLEAGPYGGNNSFVLYADDSAPGYSSFYVWDLHGDYSRARIYPGTTGSGGVHQYVACDIAGALSIYIDGVIQATTNDGPGTGVFSAFPTPIKEGTDAAGSYLNGNIKSVCQGDSYRAVALCLARNAVSYNILFEGDSNTYGSGSTSGGQSTSYPALASASVAPWRVANGGISGYRVLQMVGDWASTYQKDYWYGAVSVMIGTNDCRDSRSASDIESDLRSHYNAIKAEKARVLAITIPPTSPPQSSAVNSCAEAVNAWILAQADIAKVDAHALLVAADGHTLSAAYDSGDGLHFNQAGHVLLASAVASAIGHL
jgi:lysophospholipase L1-like esterase